MDLTLYDTMRREKVALVPRDPSNVRMYVCGPTVYDLAHIGNGRPLIVFDVLFRLLRARYGAARVTYVRNVTDVDDRINARAAERGIAIRELTEATLADLQADAAALNCLPPTHEPRATDNIAGMRTLIDALKQRGHAYVADDHALFAVASLAGYGSLSRRSLDEMLAGARIEVAPYKRDPMDFVLWKPSRDGEPAWDSPAGIVAPGRPGWHIECSAMAHRYLGETFDIHGGGIDLAFPHHENERAQSCGAFGIDEMASVWMHNGMLQLNGRKMAKSEGNFITLRDALAAQSGDVLRLAMLMTHYRSPIDWTDRRVAEAGAILRTWGDALGSGSGDPPTHQAADQGGPALDAADPAFLEALADDLNTPLAITRLTELARSATDGNSSAVAAGALLLGIDLSRAVDLRLEAQAVRAASLDVDIDRLVAARIAARAERRFADADAIRDRLVAEGVMLMDGKDDDGQPTTVWEFRER